MWSVGGRGGEGRSSGWRGGRLGGWVRMEEVMGGRDGWLAQSAHHTRGGQRHWTPRVLARSREWRMSSESCVWRKVFVEVDEVGGEESCTLRKAESYQNRKPTVRPYQPTNTEETLDVPVAPTTHIPFVWDVSLCERFANNQAHPS